MTTDLEFCDNCGTRLRADNPTRTLCAECSWEARNRRLLAEERQSERHRRRRVVAQRLAQLDRRDPP